MLIYTWTNVVVRRGAATGDKTRALAHRWCRSGRNPNGGRSAACALHPAWEALLELDPGCMERFCIEVLDVVQLRRSATSADLRLARRLL